MYNVHPVLGITVDRIGFAEDDRGLGPFAAGTGLEGAGESGREVSSKVEFVCGVCVWGLCVVGLTIICPSLRYIASPSLLMCNFPSDNDVQCKINSNTVQNTLKRSRRNIPVPFGRYVTRKLTNCRDLKLLTPSGIDSRTISKKETDYSVGHTKQPELLG